MTPLDRKLVFSKLSMKLDEMRKKGPELNRLEVVEIICNIAATFAK